MQSCSHAVFEPLPFLLGRFCGGRPGLHGPRTGRNIAAPAATACPRKRPWPPGRRKGRPSSGKSARRTPASGSFAISRGSVHFLTKVEQDEACRAVTLAAGAPIWCTRLDCTILRSTGGIGPLLTPVFSEGRVYIDGTYLKLACLEAGNGKILWQRDIAREFDGQMGTRAISMYGSACSPVVEGNLVIVAGGGSGQAFLAFDKSNGQLVWEKETEEFTQATPTPATLFGVRQLIFFTASGLISIEPKTGDELWRFSAAGRGPTAASPVVCGDIVYCSAGYGLGAAACRVARNGG